MNNSNSNNLMLIDGADASEMRVVILKDGDIEHFDFVSKSKQQIKGNIYLGKITRIEPSLQAAFVEYGGDKQGFLSFSEIHPDYYQIPVEDRKKLLEEVERLANLEHEAGDDGDESQASSEENVAADGDKPKIAKVRRRGGRRKNLNKRIDAPMIDDVENVEGEIDASVAEAIEAGQSEESVEPQITAQSDLPAGDDKIIPMSVENDDDVIIAQEVLGQDEIVNEPIANDFVAESGSKDEAEELRRSNQSLLRRYKIQEVMKPGQLVLVQVIKEERGNKGVSLSTYISLAGRYCVVMPNSPKGGGISRKIGSGDDRKRLREISDELKELRGMSAIIRTAGLDRSKTEIKRDYEYLIKLWNQVREDALSSIAPSLVYEENDIVKRTIRDHYDGHLDGILVQGEGTYRKTKEFMKLLMPSHAPKVKQYKDNAPIFAEYGVESMITELYRPVAPLKSGGYLVINPTEALISVDVNSGRSTNEKNVEETAYRTNLEACDELARQLRLRNLGGLIVVDFIDMSYHKYRRNVERALKDALKNDRAKIQIGNISSFGLLELSRQRIGSSLEESTTHACPACAGSGRLPRPDAVALQMLRNLKYFLSEYKEGGVINISVSQALLLELMNNHRSSLDSMMADFGVSFAFELNIENRDIVYSFKGKSNARFESVTANDRKAKFAPKNKKPKDKIRSDKPVKEQNIAEIKVEVNKAPPEIEAVEAPVDETEGLVKKSRRRGRRGGKNKNRPKSEQDQANDADIMVDENFILEQNILEQNEEQNIAVVIDEKVTEAEEKVVEKKSLKVEKNDDLFQPENHEQQQSKESKRKGWWQRVLDS